MKIGIFGGTFNPPHNGHLKAALAFYDTAGLDKLYIMPTYQPPHKTISGKDYPFLRLELTKILFSKKNVGNRIIEVSDYEIKAGGKSYTWQTLSHFSNPNDTLFLLCGSDMFLSLDCWKNPETIFSLATITCQRRENDDETGALIDSKAKLYREKFSAKILFCKDKPLEVSSTMLRSMLAQGQDVSFYLDNSCLEFIENHGMYGVTSAYDKIIRDITPLVGKRLDHVLSCKDEALNIADVMELGYYDKFRLGVAALLHDATHGYTLDEQLEFCDRHGITLDPDTKESRNTIHAITGGAYSRLAYPMICDKTIADMIERHTVGGVDMTTEEKILCLADYIEQTRKYPACVKMRKWFWDNVIICGQNKNKVLDLALWKYFEDTARHVEKKGENLNNNMIKAQKHLEKCIEKEYNIKVYNFWYNRKV